MMGLNARFLQQLTTIAALAESAHGLSGAARQAAVAEMSRRAVAYLWMHRQIVLPALRANHWKFVRSDFLTATVEFQSALADLLALQSATPAADAGVESLQQRAAALAAAYAATAAPAIEQTGLDEDAAALAEITRAFELPAQVAGPLDASRAGELVREAALVLRTLG